MSTRQQSGGPARAGQSRGRKAAKLRPDLSAIIGGRMAAPEPQPAADPQPLVATDTPRVAGPKGRQPGRIGKSPVPAHLPEAAYRQLRRLGIDQGKTVQRMAEEAFNDYFAKHGLPEIAGAAGS